MPAGLLMGAAGAAQGLETLLARRLRDAQFAEQQRQAQEAEEFRTRQLDENVLLRQQQQSENERMHRENEQVRKDAEARQRLMLRLQSLEPGTQIDQNERDYLVAQGMSPASFDNVQDPASRHPLGFHPAGGMVPGTGIPADTGTQGTPMFRYQGKTADRLKQEQIASTEEIANRRNLNEATIAQLRAATAAANRSNLPDPPVTITAPDGAVVQVPRSVYYSGPDATREWVMRYRQGGVQGATTGTARDQARMSETSMESLGVLEDLFANKGAKSFVGPLSGRWTSMRQGIPGMAVSPIEASFMAETATLKNQIIKAITGAQMSEPEARRIMGQIPDYTDKPEVWLEKAASTRRNLQALQSGVLQPHAGQGGMAPMASHGPGAGAPPRGGATSRYKVIAVQPSH